MHFHLVVMSSSFSSYTFPHRLDLFHNVNLLKNPSHLDGMVPNLDLLFLVVVSNLPTCPPCDAPAVKSPRYWD